MTNKQYINGFIKTVGKVKERYTEYWGREPNAIIISFTMFNLLDGYFSKPQHKVVNKKKKVYTIFGMRVLFDYDYLFESFTVCRLGGL